MKSQIVLVAAAIAALSAAPMFAADAPAAAAAALPLIDQPIAVQVETQTIIGAGRKAIYPSVEAHCTRPTGREVISGQIGRRRPITPIEIDIPVVANQGGIAI